MTWSVIRPLPDHPAIQASFDWRADSGLVTVEYIGPSLEEMHAAGCITKEILDQFTRCKFRVCAGPDGSSCQRKRWYGEAGRRFPHWKIRWLASREYALTLPGVTEPSVEPSMVQRSRCVGRLQRLIDWTVIERKLIVVNWGMIRAQTAVLRNGGSI